MSLAENIARRQWRRWNCWQASSSCAMQGYDKKAVIAQKTGLVDYIQGILLLLQKRRGATAGCRRERGHPAQRRPDHRGGRATNDKRYTGRAARSL
jgi:hypothetical protein